MTDSLILSLTPLQWLGLAGAYLLGSLSFAVLVSRVFGLADPRSYGSGNPGATNVLRSGNKAAAILTLVFDALKGYLPVLAVLIWGPRHGLGEGRRRLGHHLGETQALELPPTVEQLARGEVGVDDVVVGVSEDQGGGRVLHHGV